MKPSTCQCQLLLFVITILSIATQAFKIIRCSSNMIDEVSFDQVQKKAIIRYNKTNPIAVTTSKSANTNVELFCESDTVIKRCSLVHQSDTTSNNETKCEYSYLPSCGSTKACKDNDHISHASTSKRDCSFIMKRVTKDGKQMDD